MRACALITMQIVVRATTICIVNATMDVIQRLARVPMRTIRAADLDGVYTHPRQQVRALEKRGILHRLAHGYYCVVPPEFDPSVWHPTIEAAAAGIATVIYGDRVPVLTGLSAARVHHGLARAIGVAHVAVPAQHRPVRLLDRDGEVRFVQRAVNTLDAVLVTTELGPALSTGVEQTVLDLARADARGEDVDAREAIRALWPRCESDVLDEVASAQRMRATLARLRSAR